MEPLRIANCSGFFGDRLSAAREMVEGGPIDVLTGDYLAELTMAILARRRMRDPDGGYVPTFLTQVEEVLATCVERGIRVVANAGGLNPRGLAAAVAGLAERLGIAVAVAAVTGDDVAAHAGELHHSVTGETMAERGLIPLTANAYLGGWGIAEALRHGADVVVTGRVADASLAVGPAAWHHGWQRDDWDALAGAVVAGHVIECGAQATGGNYSFFAEVADLGDVGFPIAEIAGDGSSVITKHPGTGGAVTTGTVTAQLLYEIGGPRYLNPDVVARLDTVRLTDAGHDRVQIATVRGEPPPPTTKVAAVGLAGYRNSVTFVIPGLDVEAKAAVAEEGLWRRVGGRERYADVDVQLLRTDHEDPSTVEASFAHLKVTVSDPDATKVGRAFSNAAVELALASYPGFLLTAPPGAESPLVVYWPSQIPQRETTVEVGDEVLTVAPAPSHAVVPAQVSLAESGDDVPLDPPPAEPTVRIPLGRVVGARSGDKGGDANVGVWTRSDDAFAWLTGYLTSDRLGKLLPEAVASLAVERYVFPRLRAVNFILRGYLGEGVASSPKWDPQAKALAEYLRARLVDVPERLVAS